MPARLPPRSDRNFVVMRGLATEVRGEGADAAEGVVFSIDIPFYRTRPTPSSNQSMFNVALLGWRDFEWLRHRNLGAR
jgi:hypothetical protein